MINNPATLNLPRLQVGVIYTISVAVSLASSGSGVSVPNNTAMLQLTVISGGLTALIAGGNRQVGFDLPVVINGSASFDNDNILSEQMRIEWTCVVVSPSGVITTSPCVDLSTGGAPLDVSRNSAYVSWDTGLTLSFPPHTLAPGSFRFTLSLAKGVPGALIPSQFRTATAAVTMTVLPGSPPTVTLASSVSALTGSVLPTDQVTLSGSVDGHGLPIASTLWSAVDLDATQFAAVVLTPNLGLGYIVVQPNLAPGTYRFALTATNVIGDVSTASIGVSVNGPPRNGYLAVSPLQGVAYNDSYTLTAPGWVDDPLVSGCCSRNDFVFVSVWCSLLGVHWHRCCVSAL